MTVLAEVSKNAHGVPDIVCTLLLIFTIIALVLGALEALGIFSLGSRVGNSRFGTLVVGIILLIVYVVLC